MDAADRQRLREEAVALCRDWLNPVLDAAVEHGLSRDEVFEVCDQTLKMRNIRMSPDGTLLFTEELVDALACRIEEKGRAN